jgi:hypothetical protein
MSTSAMPLVTTTDTGWVIFRDFETLGELFITSVTVSAVVEVQSGPTIDESQLDVTVSTTTFTQAGVTQRVSLPVAGGRINRVSRIKVTSGQVKITVTAPTEFTTHLIATPDLSFFGPLS